MKTAEEREEQLRQQVCSKIRWGTRDQEVLEWLQEKHGIVDERAEAMLVEAHRAKRKAVRVKALFTLVFSALGLVIAGGFIGLQIWDGIFVIGRGTLMVDAIALTCLAAFFRSLMLLFTGRTDGSVD
jgi:hypothetical protein